MAIGGQHVAVLIDGDNVTPKVIAAVLAAVARYGTVSVRRIYGDWTSPEMKSWRRCLLEHSIQPIQQFAYTVGKNATDGAMIIDAMDLLYTGRYSSFCIVSSDSDLIRLAGRIREQGIAVYGFGNRGTTNRAFVVACNEFVYFDALPVDTLADPSTSPPKAAVLPIRTTAAAIAQSPIPTGPKAMLNNTFSAASPALIQQQRYIDRATVENLRQAIGNCNSYEDDFVNLAELGVALTRISPDLTPRNFGFDKLRQFLEASGIVELKNKDMGHAPPIALVRLKD